MGEHLDFPVSSRPFLSEEPSAFWLMRAAPLILRGPASKRILHWPDRFSAARLLATPNKDLPKTESELIDYLGETVMKKRRRAIENLRFDGATYSLTYAVMDEKGKSRWVEERGQRQNGYGASADNISAVLMDITELYNDRQRAAYEAKYDTVTGFANYGAFKDYLSSYQRFTQKAEITCVRINNLGDVEAQFGADAADYYVRAIAARLETSYSDKAFKARLAQDLLVVVTNAASATRSDAASSAASNAQPDIEKLTYILGDIPVESPFGPVPIDSVIEKQIFDPAQSLDVFLEALTGQAADEPQELATVSADSFMTPRRAAPGLDEEDVDAGFIEMLIAQRRIKLAYQPIIDAKTGELVHYEALMRYMDDAGRAMSAAPIILAAERLGRVHQLDILALDIASQTLHENPAISLALNISAGTLARTDIMVSYLALLERLGDDTRRVVIELTETMALDSPLQAGQFAARLQTLGCRFAIDDFGTGHTSFQNLLNLEAHIVKIDGSFIRDIAYKPQRQRYVRLIVEMAQTLGLKTVAEMIDNEQDANMCRRLGVDCLQGYYLGRPQLTI